MLHAAAVDAVPWLAQALGANAVFTNHDDEPQALQRDNAVRTQLARNGVAMHTYKDHTVLGGTRCSPNRARPTACLRRTKCQLRKINAFFLKSYPVERHAHRLALRPPEHTRPCPRWVRSALNKALWVS